MIVSAEQDHQVAQRVAQRLDGHHILVTGATGFLAKVIVEKLLRAVPNIGGVHLLVRPRSDGTSAEQRVRREVLGSSAMDRLRAALGPSFERRCAEKVHVVSGDLTLPRFGLEEGDYAALCRTVTLVINSAATVTFDERLDNAVSLNIDGARRLMEFAHDARVVAYTHVSTAYVSGVRSGDVPETLLPAGHSVASYVASRNGHTHAAAMRDFDLDETYGRLQALIEKVKGASANGSACARELIDVGMRFAQEHGWNDTYTFTKWLAEQFLARDRGDVPLVIFRPAIIEGSYEEPAPGWIDGLRMADPLILAYGRGKLTEFPADERIWLDFIPVDFVANAIIATLATEARGRWLAVYQCGSGARNPLAMGRMIESVQEAFRRRPMRDDAGRPIRTSHMAVVPRRSFVKRWSRRLRWTQRLRSALRSGQVAPRLRRKLASAEAQIAQLLYFVKIYAPYTHLSCRYRDDRLRSVLESMDAEDRAQFGFDVNKIDWTDYLVHRHVPGVRRFVLGSGMELEAPMLAASYAVEDEDPDAPPPMKVLAALRGESIFDAFENAALTYPSRIALQMQREGKWVRYTYSDALATTGAIARRFAEHGLVQGDHVAICADNCPEWGLTYLAAMRSGLTVVPIDRQLPAEQVVPMARFADVKLVCAGRSEAAGLGAVMEQSPLDDRIPLVVMDGSFVPPPGTARDPGPEPATVTGDAVASIVFTSGTTVAPKGVMLRHSSFLANARSLVHVHAVHADDQFLSVLPLHHVFEFTGGFLVPIANASTVTYVEHLTGPEIVAAMQATGTTVMLVVPRLLKLFHDGIVRGVEEGGWVRRKLFSILGAVSERAGGALGRTFFASVHRRFGGRLRMFVCGGSALPSALFHAFRRLGLPVYEGYGLTETAPVLTVNPHGAPRAGSVGLPLPEIELDIRNQDAEGVGELWVRGPNVMSGYYKNADATCEVMDEAGWFRTGDLCRRAADGFVYVTGRAKDVIITAAGKNVYPDEVAAHYANLPYVREMSVLAMPNDDGIGDRVDAVMVLNMETDCELDRSAIEAKVREQVSRISARIPSYQRIERIHFRTEPLPRTTTLKVRRNELVRQLKARERPEGPRSRDHDAGADVDRRATEDQAEANRAWLLDAVSHLSRRPADQIEADANLLLDLGIDSLMKIQLLSEVETHFGLRLSEEVAARVGRVSDLMTLVSERVPVGGASADRAAWTRWLGGSGRSKGVSNGRTPLPLRPVRWMLRGALGALCHSYIRVEAEGLENVPRRGAFILAANHCSHLDSVALLTAVGPALRGTGRRCYVAGAEDYFFNNAVKALVFRDLLDTIPFDRNADGFGGLRRCGEMLRAGHPLLLFPEGTRSVTGTMQPFKLGAAVLAAEVGVPIVPVHIENTYALMPKGARWAQPGSVRARIGSPIAPPALDSVGVEDVARRYATYRELTSQVEEAVAALRGQEATRDA